MSCDRFKMRCANFASIFPSVAGPAVGGFAGRAIGSKFNRPDIGMLLGSITGGTTGQLLKEKAENVVPPGTPYSLDPTDQDIPAWALQGARMLQPAMKQSNFLHHAPQGGNSLLESPLGHMLVPEYGFAKHVMGIAPNQAPGQPAPDAKQAEHYERAPIGDVLKGEVPGLPVAEAAWNKGPGAAARTFGGMAGGGLLGGGLGALGGYGIEKLLGRQVNVPGVGLSLPDLLASIGGTIGATKGLRYMKA